MKIHQLSVVHPDAKIGENVIIGPFTTIAADVEIGDDCWIAPHVSIMDGVRMGRNCKIFQGAIVGSTPQDLKYRGEKTRLSIGDNTIVREYATLNIGTTASWETVIGRNCLIMAYAHVAHDCIVGNNVVLANNVTLAGHIEIGDFARLGGMVAVHQFVKIGRDSFIGGGSLVPKDVPPFVLAARNPIAYAGVNRVGLLRRGFTQEQIETIRDIYRILFVKGGNLSKAIDEIMVEVPDTAERQYILAFIEASTRGLIKGFRSIKG